MQARKKIRKFEIVRNNSNTNRVNRHVNAVMPSLFEFRQWEEYSEFFDKK